MPELDEREIANFALTIGAVAIMLLIAVLIDGTPHVAGVGVAIYLSMSLLAVGHMLHPSMANLIDGTPEDIGHAALTFGSFAAVLAAIFGATSGGPWDVIAVIVFLGGITMALGAALLGFQATADANGGASA